MRIIILAYIYAEAVDFLTFPIPTMTALNKRAYTPLEAIKQSIRSKRLLTGFTLVEMLVVIAIAAIMLGAGVYYISALNPRKVEAEAAKLISELNRVRQAALGRHQNYTVTFDTAGDSYRVDSESGDERQSNSLAVDLTSVTDFSGSPKNQALFYYPKGTGQDRIINLTSGGKSRNIRLFSQTGYARTE